MTEERLGAIRERCEKAIPGPWLAYRTHGATGGGDIHYWIESHHEDLKCGNKGQEIARINKWSSWDGDTASFIGHCRQDIPDLLSEVDRLRAIVWKLLPASLTRKRRFPVPANIPESNTTCKKNKGAAFYDRRGIQIYPGDVLKWWHFRTRRKIHYMYKVAMVIGGELSAVDIHDLGIRRNNPHSCPLRIVKDFDKIEIVQGYGPGEIVSFDDRPRRKNAEGGAQ